MKLKAKHITSILVFFLLIFLSVFFIMEKKSQYQGASLLGVDQDLLNVIIGENILRFEKDGHHSTINLADLGILNLIGGTAYFPDGDILIRSQTEPFGLFDKLLVFFRASGDLTSKLPTARLLRCNPEDTADKCTPSAVDKNYSRTFRSLITSDGQIIIADTSNHLIQWFDATGVLVDEVVSNLKFPNKIVLADQELIVANTNKNELTIIPLLNREQGFADINEWRHLKINFDEAERENDIWPTEFVVLDNGFLVLSQNKGLAFGKLFLIDKNGNFVKEFETPEGSDIISVTLFNNEVLVSDFEKLKLYHYSLEGEFLGEYSDPVLDMKFQEIKIKQQNIQTYLLAVLILGGGVFIVLFGYAIKFEKDRISDEKKALKKRKVDFEINVVNKPSINDKDIIWLNKTTSFVRMMKLLPWILAACLVMFWMIMLPELLDSGFGQKSIRIIVSLIVMSISLLPFILLASRNLKTRLGIKGQWIIIQNPKSQIGIQEIQKIRYTNTIILVDDVAISIGNRSKIIYEPQMLKEHLESLLQHATKISELEYFKYLWQKGDPIARLWTPLAVLLGIIMIFFT